MGQIGGTALWTVGPETANTITTDERTRRQAIISAVHILNQADAAGPDREITYSIDSATKRLIVSVVDRQTGQVYVQWPDEYALQLAQEYRKEQPTDEPLF